MQAESVFNEDPNEANRLALQIAQAELRRCLHLEEIYWGQKARVNWLQLGDRNTKFYHLHVKQRRSRMAIHRLKIDTGVWCEEESVLKDKAVEFFQSQFTSVEHHIKPEVVEHIPCLISVEDNKKLDVMPEEEEIKNVVHSLSPDSAPGPDGYTGKFFTSCWDIISADVIQAVQGFLEAFLCRKVPHPLLLL